MFLCTCLDLNPIVSHMNRKHLLWHEAKPIEWWLIQQYVHGQSMHRFVFLLWYPTLWLCYLSHQSPAHSIHYEFSNSILHLNVHDNFLSPYSSIGPNILRIYLLRMKTDTDAAERIIALWLCWCAQLGKFWASLRLNPKIWWFCLLSRWQRNYCREIQQLIEPTLDVRRWLDRVCRGDAMWAWWVFSMMRIWWSLVVWIIPDPFIISCWGISLPFLLFSPRCWPHTHQRFWFFSCCAWLRSYRWWSHQQGFTFYFLRFSCLFAQTVWFIPSTVGWEHSWTRGWV